MKLFFNNDPPPICCMQQKDCFARGPTGLCSALEATDFRHGRCPFYKPAEQRAGELKEKVPYLLAIERVDLIMKYELQEENGRRG